MHPAPAFVCLSPGIEYWEVPVHVLLKQVSTLTIGSYALHELVSVLSGVLESQGSIVRWHTDPGGRWANRFQRSKVAKSFAENLPGYAGTVVAEVDGVFTSSSRLVPPLSVVHLEAVVRSRLLVIGPTLELDPAWICERSSPWASGVTETTVGSLLTAYPELTLGRLFSHCNVAVIQLFGRSPMLDPLRMLLAQRGADELEELAPSGDWMHSRH